MDVKEDVSMIIQDLTLWHRHENRLQIVDKGLTLDAGLGTVLVYLGKTNIVEQEHHKSHKEHIYWIEVEYERQFKERATMEDAKKMALGINNIVLNGVHLSPDHHVTKTTISQHHDRIVELTRMIIKEKEIRRILDAKEINVLIDGDNLSPSLHVKHNHSYILSILDEALILAGK